MVVQDRGASPDLNQRSFTGWLVAAALLVLGVGGGTLAASTKSDSLVSHILLFQAPPPLGIQSARPPRLEAMPLTPELRRKGYHECNPHDPLGLGPYAPFRRLSMGQIAIPQRGGHTPDFGYDVIIHFHGASPVRKTLVQVARGVAFVGIDRGLGSGKYSEAFLSPDTFPTLKASIENALRQHTGSRQAHIRHLALSAWSAGYGAINEILRHGDEGIDAVVLLDALHAGWAPGRPRDGTVRSVSSAYIAPIFDFARRALAGEKLFVFTHSYVDPVDYPSTALTAELLLHELGLIPCLVEEPAGLLVQDGAVDRRGLHVWSYRGHNEAAHCAHISLIARAVRDILEEAWDTPAMDRNVPNTPAPKLGGGDLLEARTQSALPDPVSSAGSEGPSVAAPAE